MSGGNLGNSGMKPAWGDVDDDETKEEKSNVSVFESGPDKDGIKTITEFRTNKEGKKVRIIRKVKVTRKVVKVNKNILARRKWVKFGDAEGKTAVDEKNVTYVAYENIKLNLAPKSRDQKEEDDPLLKLKSTSSVVKCRNCGETGHYTLKCPKRGEIKAKGVSDVPVRARGQNGTLGAGAGGKYVPMHLREGADKMRQASRDRDDSTTLRVTNISEDTTEDDLRDLFRAFGHTTRIYLAKDRVTQLSRGFAFVSYDRVDACQAAIAALHGHGYDNLILNVEFAKPREDGPGRSQNSSGNARGSALRHAGQR
jgi:translation initiation factor 3 subunit G